MLLNTNITRSNEKQSLQSYRITRTKEHARNKHFNSLLTAGVYFHFVRCKVLIWEIMFSRQKQWILSFMNIGGVFCQTYRLLLYLCLLFDNKQNNGCFYDSLVNLKQSLQIHIRFLKICYIHMDNETFISTNVIN